MIAVLLAGVMALLPVAGLADGVTINGKNLEYDVTEESVEIKDAKEVAAILIESSEKDSLLTIKKFISVINETLNAVISVKSYSGHTSTLDVGEDITLQGIPENTSYPGAEVSLYAVNKSTAALHVGGNVSLESLGDSKIDVATEYQGSNADVAIDGDVSLKGSSAGFGVSTSEDGSAIVKVNGSITSQSEGPDEFNNTFAFKAYTKQGGTIKAIIQGALKAIGVHPVGMEISHIFNTPDEPAASVSVEIGEGIISDGDGIHILSDGPEDPDPSLAENTVIVKGDVTAKDRGLYLTTPFPSTVVIDGTLSGGTAAVFLDKNEAVGDNLTLVVWKIEPNKDGAYAVRYDYWTKEMVRDTGFEQNNPLYIIRVVQPETGGTLYTEGTRTFEVNGKEFEVALAGDKIYLVGNPEEGYKMLTAFWDPELTQEMTADGENRFYMVVPVGGGVTLSAFLQQRPSKPQSVRPDYHVTYKEVENFDTWIPVE